MSDPLYMSLSLVFSGSTSKSKQIIKNKFGVKLEHGQW